VVGGAVVVVGAGIVRREALEHAMESLAAVESNTLGLILNRLPREDSSSYGSYRYEYALVEKTTPPGRRPKERATL